MRHVGLRQAARQAGSVVQHGGARDREALRDVVARLGGARQHLPFLLRCADALGGALEIGGAAQSTHRRGQLELPRARLLLADGRCQGHVGWQQCPGAPADAFRRGRGLGDGEQDARIGDPFDGQERQVGRAVAHRHGTELGRILDAVERCAAQRRIGSGTHHVAQGAIGADAPECGAPDRFVRGARRHCGQAGVVGELRQGRLALGQRSLGAGDRAAQLAGPLARQMTDALVGVGGRDGIEDGRVIEPLDRGAADPRIGVVARDGGEPLPVVRPHLAHGGRADHRVGVAPPGSQALEEVHDRPRRE